MPAAHDRLDCDPIADGHAPASSGRRPDGADPADRLVAGDDRVTDPERFEAPVVLLDVATAHAAGLDLQHRVVVPDVGDDELVDLEASAFHQDRGA